MCLPFFRRVARAFFLSSCVFLMFFFTFFAFLKSFFAAFLVCFTFAFVFDDFAFTLPLVLTALAFALALLMRAFVLAIPPFAKAAGMCLPFFRRDARAFFLSSCAFLMFFFTFFAFLKSFFAAFLVLVLGFFFDFFGGMLALDFFLRVGMQPVHVWRHFALVAAILHFETPSADFPPIPISSRHDSSLSLHAPVFCAAL